MTTNIDEMTSEQLRDALAVAAGWTVDHGRGNHWFNSDDRIPDTEDYHPIPPLDSPEALGAVAPMLQSGWFANVVPQWTTLFVDSKGQTTYQIHAVHGRSGDVVRAIGDNLATAHARLVLKVLAATRKESEEKQ